jgi:hypothetical protein
MADMETFPEVIDALGGPGKLSTAIKAPYPTVAAWKQRKSIPAGYWAAVVDAAKNVEPPVELTVEDLARIATKRDAAQSTAPTSVPSGSGAGAVAAADQETDRYSTLEGAQ